MKTANPCRKNYRPEIDPYLFYYEATSIMAQSFEWNLFFNLL